MTVTSDACGVHFWMIFSVIYPTFRQFKEARKGFFGCYSVCETMKDTKEG